MVQRYRFNFMGEAQIWYSRASDPRVPSSEFAFKPAVGRATCHGTPLVYTLREPMARLLLLVFFAVLGPGALVAQKLPVRAYTTIEGLAHNHINRIKIDSHGFLWFCTDAGLSRFDGHQFLTLTTADGLPHPIVNDLVEDAEGTFWLAGDGGISRFKLRPGSTERPKIETFQSPENRGDRFDAIEFDRRGRLWAGGRNGLYRIVKDSFAVQVRWEGWVLPGAMIPRLLADRLGGLWIATWQGAVHRDAAGRQTLVRPSPHSAQPAAESLLEDREGTVWIGHRSGGLCRVTAKPSGTTIEADYCIAEQDGNDVRDIRSIFESSDGKLWLGTTKGLCEFDRGGRKLFCYDTRHGLAQEWVAKLGEDLSGNLWLGTLNAGVIRLAQPGFVQFPLESGVALMPSRADWLALPGNPSRTVRAVELAGSRPRQVWAAPVPAAPRNYSRHRGQGSLGDSTGNWWMSWGGHLYRFFPAPGGALPRAANPEVFTVPAGHWFYGLMESAAGAIYASVRLPEPDHRRASRWLMVREKDGREFRPVSEVEPAMTRVEQSIGLGAFFEAMGEDRTGAVWLGIASNRIVYRKETVTLLRHSAGRVEEFSMADGLPPGIVSSIHFDRAGRLWIGTRAGLARADNPLSRRPRFRSYGRAEGMTSVDIWCLTEDEQGRIYAGTDRGVERLDPDSGRFRQFTVQDGLPPGHVFAAARDRRGRLWFSSESAVSRFEPEREVTSPAPAVFTAFPSVAPKLRYDRNHLEAGFSSPALAGTLPRFQYRLLGVDENWNAPVAESTVRYAGMRPGSYELQARAVNADGVVSVQPASLRFTVTPPFWRTWWFLTLALGATAAGIYWLHRYRVEQLLAVERLRIRIASDLHDDVGATMSQVSMLGELAKRSLNGDNPDVTQLIDRMAGASREAVSAMGDIVWSIHPESDDLAGLTQRMRRFAVDLLSSRGVEFDIAVSEEVTKLALGAEKGRELLLIFKECVNNAARHSQCRSVQASVSVESGDLCLCVRDDGQGFDPKAPRPGHGLTTMRTRAEKLGGRWQVQSSAKGTHVQVRIPTTRRMPA